MNKYKPFSNFIYRVPRFPLDKINKITSDLNSIEMSMRDPVIRDSIYTASPLLLEEIDKYLDGKIIKEKDKNRIVSSFVKYCTRMCSRCTPFGLMAVCGTGKVDREAESNFNFSSQVKPHTRLDMYFLCIVSQTLLKSKDVRVRLKYYNNSTIYKAGIFYRYIEYSYDGTNRKNMLVSIRKDAVLDLILKKSKGGVSYQELIKILQDEGYELSESDAYITSLIESQVLVSNIDYNLTGESYNKRLLRFLADYKFSDPVVNRIKETILIVQNKLDNLNENFKNSINVYKECYRACKCLDETLPEKYLFQIDTLSKISLPVIGKDILDNVEDAIAFFMQYNWSSEKKRIIDFRNEFYKRYETEEVQLMKVLDPELGIGYPVAHGIADESELINELSLPKKYMISPNVSINKKLLKKFIKMKEDGGKSISFDEEDIKENNPYDLKYSSSIYAMFDVIGSKNSNKMIYLKSIGQGGGNLISRFAYLDNGINDLMKNIAHKEQEKTKDGILAEIIHLPGKRVGNILERTKFRDYEITIQSNSILPNENVIPVSDILLSVKNGVLIMRSKKLNQRIYPRLTSAHNYNLGTQIIYKFLCDYQYENTFSGFFSWGDLENIYEHLPRVSYKNVILSREKWKIPSEKLLKISKLDESQIIENIEFWRQSNDLPKICMLCFGDNELRIDFSNIFSIQALFSSIKNTNYLTFQECLYKDDNAMFILNGSMCANECILPLYLDKDNK